MKRPLRVLVSVSSGVLFAACSSGSGGGAPTGTTPTAATPTTATPAPAGEQAPVTGTAPAAPSSDMIAFPGANKIVVVHAPDADFGAANNKTTEITDAAVIKTWLDTLGKVPRKGPGLKAKLMASATEYKITFLKDAEVLGVLRMKAGKLDAPADDGWDFYKSEDDAFVGLVTALP